MKRDPLNGIFWMLPQCCTRNDLNCFKLNTQTLNIYFRYGGWFYGLRYKPCWFQVGGGGYMYFYDEISGWIGWYSSCWSRYQLLRSLCLKSCQCWWYQALKTLFNDKLKCGGKLTCFWYSDKSFIIYFIAGHVTLEGREFRKWTYMHVTLSTPL